MCRAPDERSLQSTDGIAATSTCFRDASRVMLNHIASSAKTSPGSRSPFLGGSALERLVTSVDPRHGGELTLFLRRPLLRRLNIDIEAVPDPHLLIECVREGFEEVLSLAGAHDHVGLPLRDGPAPATVTRGMFGSVRRLRT